MRKLIHEGVPRLPKSLFRHHPRDWASLSCLPAVPQHYTFWAKALGLLMDGEGKSGQGLKGVMVGKGPETASWV